MTKDTKDRIFFLAISTIIVVAALLAAYSGVPSPDTAAEPVTLIVASDLHYISPELTDHGAYYQELIESGDGKTMEYCEELTDAFIEQVIAQHPDGLILSGDLTFNGAKLSHTALADKLRLIKNAGIPVLVMPGNHDLESSMAASFHGDGFTHVESIDARQFDEIYRRFGPEEAIAGDDASLSYVAELTPTLWVLMLDVNAVDRPGTVMEQTLQWVGRQLQAAARQGACVVAVSHQNILAHSSLFSSGYVMGNSNRLLALYEQYGVICNLTGHMHMQHIAQSENGLPEIATSALLVWPNQYGVLTLEGTQAEYHTVPVNVEPPDISDYAYAFFWDTAYRQAEAESNDEQLARFFADINTAYFSGRMDRVAWDDTLFQRWQDRPVFLSAYIQSIFDGGFQNHTAYSFSFD